MKSNKFTTNLIYKSFSILLLLIGFSAVGQGNFVAKSSKYQVKKNERFQITFSLNSDGDNFQGPNFENFHVLGGPNPNTSIRRINGRTSTNISYSYFLKPKRLGKFTIPSAIIKSKGKTIRSNSITIQVVDGKTEEEIQVSGLKDELFIRLILDKNTAYQGEQIIASYVLYYSKNIQDINQQKLPSLKGFWQKEIDLPQKQRLGQTTYKGKSYNTYIIKKSILFPQKFGKLTLDEMKISFLVHLPTKRRDMWGRWMTKRQEMELSSPSIELDIKPLPMEGKPANFSGAVGRFSFNSSLSNDSIKTNETVSLKAKLNGKGNLPLFKLPELKAPADIERYEPKPSDKINYNNSGVNGTKEDEYILIPRHRGTYTIPSQKFSYFDPSKSSYIELNSPIYTLNVEGNPINQNIITSINKENVDFIGKDVRYIKSTTNLLKDQPGLFNRYYFFLLWLAPILLAITLFLIKRFVLDRKKDENQMKIKKAGKKALKRLDVAKNLIKKNDSTGFYSECLATIYEYLREKLNVDVSDFQMEEIKFILSQKEVDITLISDLETMIENCQIANYGASHSSSSMENDLVKTKDTITQLDQKL